MNQLRELSTGLKITFSALICTVAVLLVLVATLSIKLRDAKNPAVVAQAEIDTIVKDIGKLMLLPKDEVPSLATVSDPSKLADQPFFAQAKAGDKVIIYSTLRKAILWRPSEKKIIEVSPLTVETASTALDQ